MPKIPDTSLPLSNDELRHIAREAFAKAAQEAIILQVANSLNRQHMAQWLDVSPSTLDGFVRAGMPRINRDGLHRYNKQTTLTWLKQFER